jgi:hypothetical protein
VHSITRFSPSEGIIAAINDAHTLDPTEQNRRPQCNKRTPPQKKQKKTKKNKKKQKKNKKNNNSKS